MPGAFTYASFSPSDGRPGGWGIGQRTGDLEQFMVDEIIPLIPTQLSDPVNLPTFPDREDLARRVRRFAWLPAPWEHRDSADTGVFLASVPAGQDATGRPGNVFTYAFVSAPGALPSHHAIRLMYSTSVPAPYGKRKVDAAAAPSIVDLVPSTAVGAPVLEAFLADPDEMPSSAMPDELGRLRPPSGPVSRREILDFLTAQVTRGRQVVLLADIVEGPLWIAALADELPQTLPDDRSFTWSTYEKATTVSETLDMGVCIAVVPLSESDKLTVPAGTVVVATNTLLPEAAEEPPAENPGIVPPMNNAWEGSAWSPAASSPEASSHAVNPFDAPTLPTHAATSTDRNSENPPATELTTSGMTGGGSARTTPEGTLPAIVFESDIDADFIRKATLEEWYAETSGQHRGYSSRSIRQYLLLDPSSDLGWITRVRLLALASYGAFPSRESFGRDRNQDALCAIEDADHRRLVEETVDYTIRYGWADTGNPDLSSLVNPALLRLAQQVLVGRQKARNQTAPHF